MPTTTTTTTPTTAIRRPGPRTARRVVAALAALAAATALVAAAPAAASAGTPGTTGGLLDLAGEPLVHTFDLDRPGDAVAEEWTVTARSTQAVAFDGVLRPDGDPDPGLAAALVVEYGSVGADGEVTGWHGAGTLAEPRSYADALGVDPVAHPGRPLTVPVRVSLPDPSLVTGEPGETVRVTASFTVTYLAPGDTGGGAGGGAGGVPGGGAAGAGAGGGGPLALTGAQAWWLAALAAAALGTGWALRRRRGERAEPAPPAA